MKRKELATKPQVRLMLDSGAFSAYVQNKTINFKNYMAFINEYRDILDTYFNLDVIPGVFKRKRTRQELEQGAKASRTNYLKMRAAGLRPIPVYHQEEDEKWLHLMVKDVEGDADPYIALSTLKELSIAENRAWLDRCFKLLCDKSGKPMLRVHGLGIASFDLMRDYPWYSCDATSWAITAAFGSILCPVYSRGKPDYSKNPMKLTISKLGKKDGSLAPDHYLRMGALMRRAVESYLEDEVGVSVEVASQPEGSAAVEARTKAVIHCYLKFGEAMDHNKPFRGGVLF